MDHLTKEKRSLNMRKIGSKNTKPELLVRKMLHHKGIRFRLHAKDLPGKPDITFKKYNTVLFVNGCFWHMHDCKYGNVRPKTNTEFWKQKRIKNRERDQCNDELLKSSGWRVLTYWECEIKDFDFLNEKLKKDIPKLPIFLIPSLVSRCI